MRGWVQGRLHQRTKEEALQLFCCCFASEVGKLGSCWVLRCSSHRPAQTVPRAEGMAVLKASQLSHHCLELATDAHYVLHCFGKLANSRALDSTHEYLQAQNRTQPVSRSVCLQEAKAHISQQEGEENFPEMPLWTWLSNKHKPTRGPSGRERSAPADWS